MPTQRVVLGTIGEQAAVQFLEESGYRIVARNYRVRGGEIDIVAALGSMLVFCEVKTRTSDRFGSAEEAVTHTKRKRLRRLAMEYLRRESPRVARIRFDVIAVDAPGGIVADLRHLVHAF